MEDFISIIIEIKYYFFKLNRRLISTDDDFEIVV